MGVWGAEQGWATSVIWNGGTLCHHTRLGKPLSPQSHSPQPGAPQTQGLIWGGGSRAFTVPLGCLRQERCRHTGKDATDAKPRARVTPPCEHGSMRRGCWVLQAASEHDGQTDRQTEQCVGLRDTRVPKACRTQRTQSLHSPGAEHSRGYPGGAQDPRLRWPRCSPCSGSRSGCPLRTRPRSPSPATRHGSERGFLTPLWLIPLFC